MSDPTIKRVQDVLLAQIKTLKNVEVLKHQMQKRPLFDVRRVLQLVEEEENEWREGELV